MKKLAISVHNLHKSFKLPHEKHTGLKQALISFKPGAKYETQRVLQNISFDIEEGEFFGVVGTNGSGKSTLLKLLAQTYTPDAGNVTVNGSLTPFIELGVGFNPELTGRENVYLNAALLGFSRRQTDEMYAGIVEFAEIEAFMDQKLKNYSSGMQVRLAFSIAIRAKSDILLIDEVLAVGDEAFQRKCLDVFEKYKATKQTIILVTHDMDTVRKFCSRAMLISKGKIVKIGNPRAVADQYSRINQAMIDKTLTDDNAKSVEHKFLSAGLLDASLLVKTSFKFGDKMVVDINWNDVSDREVESLGINIFKLSGEHVTGINTRKGNLESGWKLSRHVSLEFSLNIAPGKYYVLIELFEKPGKTIDSLQDGLQFSVASTPMEWSGLVELEHKWRGHKGDVENK